MATLNDTGLRKVAEFVDDHHKYTALRYGPWWTEAECAYESRAGGNAVLEIPARLARGGVPVTLTLLPEWFEPADDLDDPSNPRWDNDGKDIADAREE